MRRGIGLIWLGATAAISAIVGVISYQAGWAAGLAVKVPAGTAVAYYPFAPHLFGFGFGLLPLLGVLLVVFFVARAGRRWGRGPGAWGYGRFSGTTPPPPVGGDPWRDWPQRPPSEQPAPPQPPQQI